MIYKLWAPPHLAAVDILLFGWACWLTDISPCCPMVTFFFLPTPQGRINKNQSNIQAASLLCFALPYFLLFCSVLSLSFLVVRTLNMKPIILTNFKCIRHYWLYSYNAEQQISRTYLCCLAETFSWWLLIPHCPLPSVFGNYHSTSGFYEFDYFGYLM